MTVQQFYKDSIFWIEVDKIKPNPFQPRREFDEAQLKSLADSIRQYGVLQALVVTRKEVQREDGLFVEYELIAGERRLRASRLAGLSVVPCLIKEGETDEMKLELAIIENLQREDLNVVDRALAFKRLVDEFGFKNVTIAAKVGKSKEYVSNTMRVLQLPQEMIDAVKVGKITEGHTRPLLMLIERPEEQQTLFREILLRRMSVREAEGVARRIAVERRHSIKGDDLDHETREIEEKLTDTLGTRVTIERKHEVPGGKITIAFFSDEDLKHVLEVMRPASGATAIENSEPRNQVEGEPVEITDDRSIDEVQKANNTESDEELYSIKNFSI